MCIAWSSFWGRKQRTGLLWVGLLMPPPHPSCRCLDNYGAANSGMYVHSFMGEFPPHHLSCKQPKSYSCSCEDSCQRAGRPWYKAKLFWMWPSYISQDFIESRKTHCLWFAEKRHFFNSFQQSGSSISSNGTLASKIPKTVFQNWVYGLSWKDSWDFSLGYGRHRCRLWIRSHLGISPQSRSNLHLTDSWRRGSLSHLSSHVALKALHQKPL